MKHLKMLAFCASAAITAFAGGAAHAVVIGNGGIYLGVNATGELNTYDVGPTGRYGIGLFDARTGLEATFDGCTCEGWGVADASSGTSGWANTSSGSANLSLVNFAHSATTATSIVDIYGARSMRVTQAYMPTTTEDLYKAVVTIENIGDAAIGDLRYRRVMDWDIEPTAFNEYVTINGVNHPNVWGTSDDGFASSNPLSGLTVINSGTANQDFVNSGPNDHGALFDFQFGSLAIGASTSFTIYYGASASENAARAALAQVGAEVFSLAKSSDNVDGDRSGYSVFTFGFDIVDNDGSSPAQALLGDVQPDGSREFEAVVERDETLWIDPDVATGYDYTSDAAILTAMFEDLGDSDGYNIYLLNDPMLPVLLASGWMPTSGAFTFADYTSLDVFGFRVDGIDTDLMLDPSSLVAFRTGLTFDADDGTTVHVTQTPITTFVPDGGSGAVPEPASWAMMLTGFGLVGGALRNRRSRPLTA
jgi:hypothetical protein